ncbi:MAG: hypothetical protein U5Q16_16860 [Gammaproteobacteria bacterium]|nr:hypothetical protein [Gammaproteobacteria bacterium]
MKIDLLGPGFWAVTRYDDVAAIGRDPKTYSSEPTIMIPDPAQGSGIEFGDRKMMLMMDPPAHTQFRKIISREFTKGPAARRWAQTLPPHRDHSFSPGNAAGRGPDERRAADVRVRPGGL